MRPHGEAAIEGPGPVLEERGALGGDGGLEVGLRLVVGQARPLEEGGLVVEHARGRR